MALEIERKFLVRDMSFKSQAYKSERISQGYLSTDPKRSVRIRVKGDQAFITIKGESDKSGLTRFEWEKEIALSEAQLLLQLCDESTIIDKTRYCVKANDSLYWEVDEFYGLNEGLFVAEIELQHQDDCFDKPHWLGVEVTGRAEYYNSQLSKYPYSKWKAAE